MTVDDFSDAPCTKVDTATFFPDHTNAAFHEQMQAALRLCDVCPAVDSLSDDETRAAATACISKALGYSDAIHNQWTARVLRLLDAADIAFTRTRPTGDGND